MMRWLRSAAIAVLALLMSACGVAPEKQQGSAERRAAQLAKAKPTDFARLESIYCLKVAGSDAQHFITGSVHFPLFFKLEVAEHILALAERSDVLLLEATLPPIREEVIESERLRTKLGELDRPIADKVLEQIDQRLGRDRRMSRQAWLRLTPIAINQGLESQIGFPRPRGHSLDAQFVRAARRGKSEIDGIEQMREQVLVVNQISAQQWEKIFRDQLAAIGNVTRREQLLDSIRAQYRTFQDARWDAFDAAIRAQNHYLSMLTLAVSDARNQTLADRIDQRLKTDPRSHFIVLGAAHLGGEEGVFSLLQAKGAILEKNCAAVARPSQG